MAFSRTLAVALAAGLAATALAEEAAPAAASPPGDGAKASEARRLSRGQAQAVATLAARNELAVRVGDLATTRATTPDLQNLGRWIAEDHRRLKEELARLLAERGVTETTGLPQAAERDKLESEFMQLASMTGPEFDRELGAFLSRSAPLFVAAVKRARDATPGDDERFARFLDDAESVEEGHLTASREGKAQRQARTPRRP